MESHFFRRLCALIGPELMGLRVEKIYDAGRSGLALRLGAAGRKHHLLVAPSPAPGKSGILFLSDHKPDAPDHPTARTMGLRKHSVGRVLVDWALDWPERRLACKLSGRTEDGSEPWLLIDLGQGVSVVGERPLGFEPGGARSDIDWPQLDEVLGDAEIWRIFPHITPPLRRHLAALDPDAARLLYARLQQGDMDDAWLHPRKDGPPEALLWPAHGDGESLESMDVLAAARQAGEPAFFQAAKSRTPDSDDLVRARLKRLRRNRKRMERERERLVAQRELEDAARALQARLYELGPRTRLHVFEYAGAGEGGGEERRVDLAPGLTLAENMELLFRRAAKARRGLAALDAKLAALDEEQDGLASGARTAPPAQERPARNKSRKGGKQSSSGKSATGKSGSGLAVQRFRTEDGFLLLRGKNAKSNHGLLSKAASPFDYWFHAQDGPGAHLLLKRDHPGQEVPERSLEQAAVLAALKSWQAEEPNARVICALVKDVRKVKGAAHGQVQVHAMERVVDTPMQPDLEERLRVD